MNLDFKSLIDECSFSTTRSGGKGGQNVNKLETKVVLAFDVENSKILTDEQKDSIREKLQHRINKNGILQLSDETDRTQWMNKRNVINRFTLLIIQALKPVKQRKATKPTVKSIQKRLDEKKKLGEKKKLRSGKWE